jgi:hypothetical protein
VGKSIDSLVAFTGGEASPKVDARVDQAKYRTLMRQCLNMIPYKTGGLTRRPGTQWMGTAKYTALFGGLCGAIVHKFEFSPTTSFIMEFGHRYVRFYSNGLQVTVSTANAWVAFTYYHVGDFVSNGGNIYYCIQDVISAATPPTDPIKWVRQTILECPTPYCGIYWPATYSPPTWTTGNQYFPGDFIVTFLGGPSYRCLATNIATASFAADLASGFWVAAAYPTTPYDTDLYLIDPKEINDVVYIAHPKYAPYSLTRIADSNWHAVTVPFLSPALLDQNATDTLLTPSALRGTITLTASAPAWISRAYYQIGNSVQVTGQIYTCVLANVSGATFAADFLLNYWQATNIFNVQQVGGTWQLAALRDSAYVEYTGVAATGFAAGNSGTVQCLGSWEVHTYGVWDADIAIQRSLDGGITYNTVRKVTGRSDRNVDITGVATVVAIYRIVVTNTHALVNPGATAPRVVFECVNAFLYGLVQITAYTSATVVTGNVLTQLSDTNPLPTAWSATGVYVVSNTATYDFVSYTCISNVGPSATPPSQDTTHWAYTQPGGTEFWGEAAWSNYRGFPQAVTAFQQRMIYGGSGYEPQRIWGTVINDIENFALGDQTRATDAVVFDLNAPGRGPIAWLEAQTNLFVGFTGAEWLVNSGSAQGNGASTAIAPDSVNAVEQSAWGSALGVRPFVAGDALMFTQRQGTSLRQMKFSIYTNKYMSQDMTSLSEHMFAAGIAQMAYQKRWRKQSNIWAITKQGLLCGMTYDFDQDVFGWSRQQTGYGQTTPDGTPITPDNGFESVAVIDGQGLNEDEVWVVANRLIGGVQTRFIERINPNNWEETFSGSPNAPAPSLAACYYFDSGQDVTNLGGGPGIAIPGFSRLVGRYVLVRVPPYIAGDTLPTFAGPVLVDATGSITLPTSINPKDLVITAGLPIAYAAQPMRIDSDPRAGSTQGLYKQISDVYVRVMNSMGGSIGNGTSTYPTWLSALAHAVGSYVISPLNAQAYYCAIATVAGRVVDPSADAPNWVQVALPNYRAPVPINYVPTGSPAGGSVLVTTPTDIRIQNMQNPTPGADPVFIVQGNDALPLTILALIYKYDLTGVP